ncbi:BgTH12-02821 [Blumeria graminis f. sp. triticale]|uniref:BgTH12-02821 n=1 Tax=Blumeria graminis f. sp. triticale TaxID=1689686 RepID=A0A9W4GF33_BLUGR|nr:BgTH12-02821 [Blumeria graminis f. sp. triticale]
MRSLEQARQRWQITRAQIEELPKLKQSVRIEHGRSLGTLGLRSVLWKTFLLLRDHDFFTWPKVLAESRSAYASLRQHFLRFIENPDELASASDPLDDDQNSPWNSLRRDEEIRTEIFQDVQRCMPEVQYFREAKTQQKLLDILFIYCKINQDVGYRQGMHELLAPILWVIEQDAIDSQDTQGLEGCIHDEKLMREFLDPSYIEHDTFTLLSMVMRSAKSFYELGGSNFHQPSVSNGAQVCVTPIIARSQRIHEVYLASLDPQLAEHLTEIEVLPQVFLIRWIRLLFGREFSFNDLLSLWDLIFAEDPRLALVDLVCVAMLLRIRWQLVSATSSVALILLSKYPPPLPPNGPQTLVDDAIFLRDNLNVAAGTEIINKYNEKSFKLTSGLRALGRGSVSRHAHQRTISPLSSPAKFLQQQGGVEGLFQDAFDGFLNHGERLGINQAVREAVGEVKRNMQGLQVNRRASESVRGSFEETSLRPTSKSGAPTADARNQQLAQMLIQAISELRAVSNHEQSKESIAKIDAAIAKIDFVRVYLEDSTILLPETAHSPSKV